VAIDISTSNGIDWDFLKSIALITIPTLSGIIASKLIVNSWQIRNEKSRIKRQILNEYENSGKLMRGLMVNFVRKVTFEFTEPDLNDQNISPEYKNDFKQAFQKKFGDGYAQLENDINNVELTSGKLYSSLRLYYKNEKLVEEHRKLLSFMSDMFLIIRRMFNMNNFIGFTELHDQFVKSDESLLNELKNFEMKLINLKLDKNVI